MPLFRRDRAADHAPATHHEHEPRSHPIGTIRRIFTPPPAPSTGERTHHETDPTWTFASPARGDIFDFTVMITLKWCAKGVRSAQGLHEDIGQERARVQGQIREIVRRAGRRHDPFSAHGAEEEINRALEREFDSRVHFCDDVEITCTPAAEVALSDEVRESRVELGHGLLKLEARAEIDKLRIRKMAELRDLWLEFLGEHDKDSRTRFAVQLAESPVNVAEVMDLMLAERREEVQRLLQIVDSVISSQKTANVYDLVVASETALRKTLELMGLPVPENDMFNALADDFR